MKSNERIDVWISPEGAITIDAVGFTGSNCEEATRFLEEELGSINRKHRTRDYYRKSRNRNTNPQKQKT